MLFRSIRDIEHARMIAPGREDDHFPQVYIINVAVHRIAHVANILVPNTAKSQSESSAPHSTVSMRMWYSPLSLICSKPLPAGQITGVCGTQRGIGHALSGASGGDEVFQDRHSS